MPARQDIYEERAVCPLYTAIAVIEGRWKPMIVQRLSARPQGFGELRRAMPGVTTKVLREQLRQLLADDLIAREDLNPRRLGVRYRVTQYGRTLGPVFETLWRWGRGHVLTRGARARHPGMASGHGGRIVNGRAPAVSWRRTAEALAEAGQVRLPVSPSLPPSR